MEWIYDAQMEVGIFAAQRPARDQSIWIVTHRYFEFVIMVLILVSSIALALDTPYLDPESSLASWLGRLDTFFLVVFTLKMLLKMLAF